MRKQKVKDKILEKIKSIREWINRYDLILFLLLIFAINVYIFGLVRVYTIFDIYLRLILTSWSAVILILGIWRRDIIDYMAKHLESFELFGAKGKIKHDTVDQQSKESSIENAVKEVRKQEAESGQLPGEDAEKLKARIQELEQAVIQETKEKLFERIYRLIYGSQISLLFALNIKNALTAQQALQYYINAANRFANLKNYPFSNYMNFLQKSGLLTIEGNFPEENIFITEQGREFLNFLINQKLDINKIY